MNDRDIRPAGIPGAEIDLEMKRVTFDVITEPGPRGFPAHHAKVHVRVSANDELEVYSGDASLVLRVGSPNIFNIGFES